MSSVFAVNDHEVRFTYTLPTLKNQILLYLAESRLFKVSHITIWGPIIMQVTHINFEYHLSIY